MVRLMYTCAPIFFVNTHALTPTRAPTHTHTQHTRTTPPTHTHSLSTPHTHMRTHARTHTNYTLATVFFQTYPSPCLHQRSTSNTFLICAYKLVANASHTHMYAYVYKMSLKVVGQCSEKVLRIFLRAHYLYESTQ